MVSYILTLDKQMLIQLGFQLLNTVILCLGLGFILYKPVLNFLALRKEKIATQLSKAEAELVQANKFKAEYEQKLKSIEAERSQILDEARNRAKENEKQIISEAKKEAETLKNRAMIDIQREQEKAKDEIRKQIIEVSSLMTSRFIASSMDEATQNKLVDEVISDLGEVKWQS